MRTGGYSTFLVGTHKPLESEGWSHEGAIQSGKWLADRKAIDVQEVTNGPEWQQTAKMLSD